MKPGEETGERRSVSNGRRPIDEARAPNGSADRTGSLFTRFAKETSRRTGHPSTFLFACGLIVAWLLSGPLFGFSDTWQLVINTGTTIVTFLMVFLIQNTQNRDSQAIQIKLDELIRAVDKARNSLIDLEDMDDKQLDALHARYTEMGQRARESPRP